MQQNIAAPWLMCVCVDFQIFQSLPTLAMIIANLRYPAKNDKFFAGERRLIPKD
jgi:hypothetical protein